MGYVRLDAHDPPEDGWVRPAEWPVPIVDPEGKGPLIWVVPVPEKKTIKNRMHIDVFGDPEELLKLGASLLRRKGDGGIEWDLLADPEGNEFCVFAPR